VGDSGVLLCGDNERIEIIDTVKENNLILHIANKLPSKFNETFHVKIDKQRRTSIEAHHSATHLLHYALREVLGSHIEQKGSFVSFDRLRFDFSHHSKMSEEQIMKVEKIVNSLVREDYKLEEMRDMSIEQARQMGAVALFGEKYGDKVRVVKFGDSIELCGGTHAKSTGTIGMFKIVFENAVAAGVRRIEAVCGEYFENYFYGLINMLNDIKGHFEASPNIVNAVRKVVEENASFKQELEQMRKKVASDLYTKLKTSLMEQINGINIVSIVDREVSADIIKDLAFRFRSEYQSLAFIAATYVGTKPTLTLMLSDDMVAKGKDASAIIRSAAKLIAGGGGGQKHFAQAGGKNIEGLAQAAEEIRRAIL
jgi:alanyl-tRNA synthetase